MTKTKNDKIYEAGVKHGLDGCFLTDAIDSLGKSIPLPIPTTEEEKIYEAGVKWGTEHRYDSPKENPPDSDNSSSESGSGGGLCYLTTACVNIRGLPDNCLELNVLRNFRDRILLQTPNGRKTVEEYYQIAPEVVQAVNEKDNSSEIWDSVYQDIRKAVQLVLSGDFNGAFEHYKEMTLRLKKKN